MSLSTRDTMKSVELGYHYIMEVILTEEKYHVAYLCYMSNISKTRVSLPKGM